jgi:biotin carboxyl carrier protein
LTTRITVDVRGIPRTVDVRQDGGRLVVVLDGREQAIDAVQAGPGRWSLLVGPDRVGRDVRVRHDRAGVWTVFLAGAQISVAVREPGRRRPSSQDPHSSGPARITAPMAGKVVRLLVAGGDVVSARQGVAVVEAMKMENELKAPRAGTVLDVFVREGASVESGAPLMLIG